MGILDSFLSNSGGGGLLGMDPNDPRQAGMLNMALGLLAQSGPSTTPTSFGQAFGKAGMAGMQGYQQAQQAQQERALRDLQMRQAQLGLQKTETDLAKQKRLEDAYKNFYSQGGTPQGQAPAAGDMQSPPAGPQDNSAFPRQPMPDWLPKSPAPMMRPSLPQSAPNPSAAGMDNYSRHLRFAQSLESQGFGEEAAKYYDLAEKFKPEFATEPRTVMGPDGKPMLVQMAKDGTVRPIQGGYSPAEKLAFHNTGGQTVGVDPYTGKPIATMKNTMTPDAIASNGIANRRLGLEFGLTPEGTAMDSTTAKAIAEGRLPPPSGMALTNPRNQRILSKVMEINPNYDFTDVTAKRKAASDFTSGQLGNQMRSFSTAGQHLDQLGQLAYAQDNRNLQVFNKVANSYATQTGQTAPTNFEAAKDVVSKEVMKAIVSGGGGQAEREELARTLSAAQSPAQLKGVISQYRNLMNAQYENLLAQRRASGLSDTTLPKYGAPGGAPTSSGAKFLGFE